MKETKIDVESLVARSKKAFGDKSNWDSLIREMYRYAMPQRDRYDTDTAGSHRADLIFDSTAVKSVKKYAGRVVTEMFPTGRQWAQLEPGPAIRKENEEEAREELQTATDITFNILHNATNFNTAIGEFAMDLPTGTAAMLCMKGESIERPIRFQAVPVLSIALDEGPAGSVGGVFRKPQVLHRNLQAEWPDIKLDDTLRKTIQDEPNKKCAELIECTVQDNESGKWVYTVLLAKGNKLLVEREYSSNPWVVVRLNKAAKEVFGRGPLLDVLSDVKTINKLIELVLRNAALSVSGAYTAVDDGVLNPDTVRITPGAIISVSRNQGHPQGASLMPLERTGGFDVAQLEHERLAMSIKEALLDQNLPPMEGGVRTATEFVQRLKDLYQDIGAAFGRLVVEGMVPIMQRCIDILTEWGLLDMEGVKIGGAGVRLVVTGPLAQLQAMDDVQRLVQAIELSYQLTGKEATMRTYKMEDVPAYIAKKLSFPVELLRDEEEIAKIDEMAKEAAAMMAQQEGVGAVAGQANQMNQPMIGGA